MLFVELYRHWQDFDVPVDRQEESSSAVGGMGEEGEMWVTAGRARIYEMQAGGHSGGNEQRCRWECDSDRMQHVRTERRLADGSTHEVARACVSVFPRPGAKARWNGSRFNPRTRNLATGGCFVLVVFGRLMAASAVASLFIVGGRAWRFGQRRESEWAYAGGVHVCKYRCVPSRGT